MTEMEGMFGSRAFVCDFPGRSHVFIGDFVENAVERARGNSTSIGALDRDPECTATKHVMIHWSERMKNDGNKMKHTMWLLGFEPRSPRPQRGILTTKLQPHAHVRVPKSVIIAGDSP